MSKTSSKTSKWTKKMNKYYKSVSKQQLSNDLNKAGFKVTPKK